jgi:hypothetical protein
MMLASRRHLLGELPVFIAPSLGDDATGIILGKLATAIQLLPAGGTTARRAIGHYIERVIVGPMPHIQAEWNESVRACLLDSTYVATSSTRSIDLALLLVHEAQHARLMRLGIPYKADTRLRVERSCIEAEREFARATGCDQATVDRILLKYEQAEELWDPARLADLKIATLRGLHPPRWILWVASAIIRRRAA